MLRLTPEPAHPSTTTPTTTPGPGKILAITALTLAVAAGPPRLASAGTAQDVTDLASRASGAAGSKGDDFSGAPSISADGDSVAFASAATNLHPDDPDSTSDIFVRHLPTVSTALASRASGAAGAKGNGASSAPAIAADGRFVAYDSFSTNLHPDDPDALQDVFVRDLDTAATILVSRADGAAGAKSNGFSTDPAISADGRFVAFHSTATNLHPDDVDATLDVFVRDLTTNETVLVSRADGAAGAKGNQPSTFASISADGRFIAFVSTATNLHPDDPDTLDDVYVRDLLSEQTLLVSRAGGVAGAKGDFQSQAPAISADGTAVAFDSFATNFVAADDDVFLDIYVRDLVASTTRLVSRGNGAAAATGNDHSVSPTISGNGRYIAFHTLATNLHPDDSDAILDVLQRDLVTHRMALVSRATGAGGTKGNGDSFTASSSADGSRLAFESFASNLDPDDPDAVRDVFRRGGLGPSLFADGFESGDTNAWSQAVP